MAVNHYENFPVASLLIPAPLRPAIRALYAFARGADDIADEGVASRAQRQAMLALWVRAVHTIADTQALPPELPAEHRIIFERLAAVIKQYQLPIAPLLDLLAAFTQDLHVQHYVDEATLLDYCKRSANPVGVLMLHLFQAADSANIAMSDAICTGLQRVNFCQDVAIDFAKGRCYIPLQSLHAHGLGLQDLASLCTRQPATLPPSWQALMQEQAQQARRLLVAGSPLAWRLPGRFGLELRLVVHAGLRVLEKLAANGYNPICKRPTIGRTDLMLLSWRALLLPCPAQDPQARYLKP